MLTLLPPLKSRRTVTKVATDWLSTPAALLAAAWLRVALNAVVPSAGSLLAVYARPYGWPWYPDLLQPQVLLLAAALWPIFLVALDAYGDHAAAGLTAELGRVVLAAGLAGLSLVVALALSPLEAPGLVLVVFLVIDVGLLIGVRLALAASSGRRNSKRIFDVIGAAAALAALPGITGLWQVRGRNRVSFDEMVRMDLEYIERQSFWLDLRLVLETPWAALAGRGAG